jgi:hypothetical protein
MPGRRAWNGAPDNPSTAGAVSAITRVIGAAGALGARGRAYGKEKAARPYWSLDRLGRSPRGHVRGVLIEVTHSSRMIGRKRLGVERFVERHVG